VQSRPLILGRGPATRDRNFGLLSVSHKWHLEKKRDYGTARLVVLRAAPHIVRGMLIYFITRHPLCKPFFDAHEVPLDRVLTDRDTEYCGSPDTCVSACRQLSESH